MKIGKGGTMRKILFFLLCAFLFLNVSTNAIAKKTVAWRLLEDAAGTSMSAYSLTISTAVYSETIDISNASGYMTLLVTEDKSGGGGDVDISAEYSIDGTNFYTAGASDMSGTVTNEGNIATGLGNTTKWMIFTFRMSHYMRIKFDPDANSQVTAYLIYQQEN